METAGTTPRVSSPLTGLARLFDRTEPVATVLMATDAGMDNPGSRALQRWKPIRADLALQTAPDSCLDAIEAQLEDAHHGGPAILLVADADGIIHGEFGPEAPPTDGAWWAQLPRIGPAITWRQATVPHVVVATDRAGADVTAVSWTGAERTADAGGNEDPITKSAPGGWSQKRYQQRAEQTWERNAKQAAEMVVTMAEKVDARVICVAGDERAIELLRGDLPPQWNDLVQVVRGGRAADGSDEIFAEEVRRMVNTAAASGKVEVLAKFKEELGQADRAVTGTRDTFAALTAGQVDTLLIHDDLLDERTAYFGIDAAIPVGLEARILKDLGVAEPLQGRLVDVAIRAAFGTSASVHIVPAHGPTREGIGALLRWR